MKKTNLLPLATVLFLFFTPPPIRAQQTCQPPALPIPTSGQNIFTEEQEMMLGDAIAEHLQRDHAIIDDAEVTAYLKRIGARLIQHLPPTELKFQFFVFDINDVNAFTLPGGRIYVSRKMIAFARNEDELAGVVAHELGHIIARHSTMDMTFLMREILGVTEVSDRRDIFQKYNLLIENTARKRKVFEKLGNHEEGTQNVADLIGLYAMTRSGYDPQAQAALWDRYHELRGKTGGFFSDLFGRTKPGQKRLREMLKGLATLPPECLGTKVTSTSAEFQQWQSVVIGYTGLRMKESLTGLLAKRSLNPALRSDIHHLRFSPDGQYLLAQDDSGISVLNRKLTSLFRIYAPDARPAQFSPDSTRIVFHTPNLRVESWDVKEQKLKNAHEVILRRGCLQTTLSSDGKTLACLDTEYGLVLVDTATGTPIVEKKSFSRVGFSDIFMLLMSSILAGEGIEFENNELINMSFSPDAQYFVAGDRSMTVNGLGGLSSNTQSFAFDLTKRVAVPLKGDMKNIVSSGFAFVGSDKIAGRNDENLKKSGLYSFPSGAVIENFEMFANAYTPVTSGDFVVVRAMGQLSGGLMNLKTKKILNINNRPILDAYNDTLASEQRNSELGLYVLDGVSSIRAALPQTPLGRLYAADITPDFKWLAVSGSTRGAVWDLDDGKMIFFVRAFRGAYFGDDNIFYADFPRQDNVERNIAQLNLNNRDALGGPKVANRSARQHGPYLVQIKESKDGYWQNVVMEVLDARNMSPVIALPFPKERPQYWLSGRRGTLSLLWPVSSKAAAAEIKANPTLAQQLKGMKEKEGDYFLKAMDVKSGKTLGQLLIETGKGSFRIQDVVTVDDWVVISDNENRSLIYSLSTGEQKGTVFGSYPTLSVPAKLICVETDDGVLSLYDIESFERRRKLTFPSHISFVRFSEDGKRLFVLTADQNVYFLDVTGTAKPAQ
jgi:WD40 repeat protein